MVMERVNRKIALVTMDVRLPGETQGLDRTAFIAGMLADAGYEVDLITSSFQHWDKAQRNTADPAYQTHGYRVVFIDAPNYSKNVTPSRVRNHTIVSRRLAEYFKRHNDYGLVLAKVPPNDMALVCAKYAEEAGIPFVVDVNDLWPEAMRMVFDVPVLSPLLFRGFKRDAEAVYARTTAAIGTSEEYALRPSKYMNHVIPHITVYVGNDVSAFDAEAAANASLVQKPEGEFWVTYAGTIGTSYDIRTMVLAADHLKRCGHADVRMVILGDGPLAPELRQLAAQLGCNCTFLGYRPHEEMAAYLQASDVLVNSFVKKAPQSIVSKIGDYLAAGKPMINTLANEEFTRKVANDGFGVNIASEDPDALAAAILELQERPQVRARMGAAARRIAEEQFDRPVAYQRIVKLVDNLLSE